MKLFMCKLTQDFFTRSLSYEKLYFLYIYRGLTTLLTWTLTANLPSHREESSEHVTLKWLIVDYMFYMLIGFSFFSTNT